MAVVVVPWTIRNQQTFHQFVPVSNNLGTALAGANCRLTYSGTSLGSWRSTFGTGDAAAGRVLHRLQRRRSPDSTRRGPPPTPATGASPTPATTSATCPKVGARPPRCGPSVCSVPSSRSGSRRSKGRPLGWERVGTWLEWVLYAVRRSPARSLLVRRRAPVWPLAASVLSVLVSTLRHLREPTVPHRRRTGDPRRRGDRPRRARRPVPGPAGVATPPTGRIAPLMFWLEGRVVTALAGDDDQRTGGAITTFVDIVARRDAPAPPARRGGRVRSGSARGSGSATVADPDRAAIRRSMTGWEHHPVGVVRQYPRLLSSLVLFAQHELASDVERRS